VALLTRRNSGVRTPRGRSPSRYGGFTLVELAVVVAVIALLLGSLLIPLTTQVEQRNVSQTDQQLEDIRQALIGFAMVNGRLPRPSSPTTNGVEVAADCASQAQCTGFVPWVTLGVSQTDAWGKQFRYSVSQDFANSAGFNFSTPMTNAKSVQTRDSTGTAVPLANNLVAVVMSYGAKNFGTTADGTTIANSSTTNVDEQSNDTKFNTCSPDCTSFFARPAASSTGATGGDFDDRVVWISQSFLLNRMVTAGKLP
jgi:prepilin-type N-terminal cleavage/methylation domain-containing protein